MHSLTHSHSAQRNKATNEQNEKKKSLSKCDNAIEKEKTTGMLSTAAATATAVPATK